MGTDPIADLLTRVRNAVRAKHRKVDVPASHLKAAVVDIWRHAGFIRDYKLFRNGNVGVLRIYLKYADKNRSIIEGIKRVSKPSKRVYASHEHLPRVLGGLGMAVISTSKGVLSDVLARENKVGGEILCTIW